MEAIGIWIAAALTLAIYSFLYKDNPAYKIAEHIFVGVSVGFTVCITWHNVIRPEVFGRLQNGDWVAMFPVVLGFLMFTRFSKKISWPSRIAMAFVVGAGAGIGVPNTLQALIIRQTESTIGPVISVQGFLWNDLIILIGVISVLVYFFFSVEHKGFIKWVSSLGVLFLMVYFGASFGYTVMARVSLVIGRMRFLILDWLAMIF